MFLANCKIQLQLVRVRILILTCEWFVETDVHCVCEITECLDIVCESLTNYKVATRQASAQTE